MSPLHVVLNLCLGLIVAFFVENSYNTIYINILNQKSAIDFLIFVHLFALLQIYATVTVAVIIVLNMWYVQYNMITIHTPKLMTTSK
jgi:hypothetical protein